MNLLQEALIALISGITTYHPDHPKEIMWRSRYSDTPLTIEPLGENKYLIRYYRLNGSVKSIYTYTGNLLSGPCCHYSEDGKLISRAEYVNGQLQGIEKI